MTITNSEKTLFPGVGNVTEYQVANGNNVPINATTTFTLTGFINYLRSGRVRFKAAVPASAQITGIVVTGTDGTTIETLINIGSRPAGQNFEQVDDFISDLNLTSFSAAVTTVNAGTASTLDWEVAGNP